MILILDLPSGTKIQFSCADTPYIWQAGFERVHIQEIAMFEFSTERKFSVRYYNSATGESFDQDVTFANETTSIAIDINAHLENKRRRMEIGYEFYRKVLALRNTDTISKKECEKLTNMWNEGKNPNSENGKLALQVVRQQFNNLKIGE